ncbi:hypothetical protein ACOMHN_016432 [Nucella lapillus]
MEEKDTEENDTEENDMEEKDTEEKDRGERQSTQPTKYPDHTTRLHPPQTVSFCHNGGPVHTGLQQDYDGTDRTMMGLTGL